MKSHQVHGTNKNQHQNRYSTKCVHNRSFIRFLILAGKERMTLALWSKVYAIRSLVSSNFYSYEFAAVDGLDRTSSGLGFGTLILAMIDLG